MAPMRRLLLATTALAGAATLGTAQAAEVVPGGALNVTVSGYARFVATGGDIDDILLDDTLSTGLDFSNETEVHVLVAGKHDATGVEYGGHVELEADTNVTENADETWVFLKGGWGEVRLGDEDGVADTDGGAVSAATLAAGTGGIDGDYVFEDLFDVPTYEPLGTSDATKVRYFTPELGGFQLGVDYTPNLDGVASGSGNGDALALKDVEAGDVVAAIGRYEGDLGGVKVEASLSGMLGDVKDEDGLGGDDYWAAQAGAVVEVLGVKLGGSYLVEEVGSLEVEAITAGIGAEIGRANLSVTYGQVVDSDDLTFNDNDLDQPGVLVVSADIGLLPGLTLAGDVGYVDNDVDGDAVGADGDDGWIGIARLGVAF